MIRYSNKANSLSKNVKYEEEFIEEIFKIIENTLDTKLENNSEEQLLEYFNTKTDKIYFRVEDDKNSAIPYEWWENTKCGDTIIAVVGNTVFASAKLLKLKKDIKALG